MAIEPDGFVDQSFEKCRSHDTARIEDIAQREATKDETIASLAIQEVRHLLKIKKIREQRRILRNKRKK